MSNPVTTNAPPPGGRNVIICCDGTNNAFGECNTSVVRLVRVLERDPNRQIVYYDAGVGTLPARPGQGKVSQKWSRFLGLAFGQGVSENVAEAYRYLMNIWQPGDRLFLFGFSRGAYTVRVLAGLLWQFGLLDIGQEQLIPYALRLLQDGQRGLKKNTKGPKSWLAISDQFRSTFARESGQAERRFDTHFLGVWDTVSSVGWVWTPQSFPFTGNNPGIQCARHAISLDEHRAFFRTNRIREIAHQQGLPRGQNQNLVERWFPGVHSDIGGGYPEADGNLWRLSFDWLVAEAITAGALVRPNRLSKLQNEFQGDAANEPKHESLDFAWWLAEFFPKRKFLFLEKREAWRINFFARRNAADADLDASVLRRIQADSSYRPRNIPEKDTQIILAMAPNALPKTYHISPPSTPVLPPNAGDV